MSMLSISSIKKAVTLAHAVFEDHCTGKNANREQLPNEMKFSILIVASRFLEAAELFARNSCTQWTEVATSTVTELNGAIMVKYADAWELWKEEKKTEFHNGSVFPRSKLADRIGYKAMLDEEMQLIKLVKDFIHTPKNRSARDKGVRMGNLVLQIATLAAGIVGVVDCELGNSVQQRLTHAVVDYPRQTAVYLANTEQRSLVIKRLKERRNFEYDAILKMSNQNIYVITCGAEMQVCGYVFVNLPIHLPPQKNKDAIITFIETLPGHRRYSLASKLLEGIKLTARNNGYRSICAESLAPDPLFWIKCGFVPYMDKKIRHATCCLDKMSFMNILNHA
jgi:hypothetical protein